MIHFSTTDKISRDAGVKALVYGKAGIGKTTLCATAPKPLIISCESGLLSLKRLKIPVATIETFDDLRKLYKQISAGGKFKNFETICLDSLSEIAERILAAAKLSVRDKRQAYGSLIEETIDMAKKFRDLPGFNVVMTAKEEKYVDTISESVSYGPAMPGSRLGKELPYLVDELFAMGAKRGKNGNLKRFVRTASDLQYEAKDRSGELNEFELPDLTAIFAKIKKG